MSRVLYCGDSHVRQDDLEDCSVLINGIADLVRKEAVDRVVFLGDQFHSHAIVHLEVLRFWRLNLQAFADDKMPVMMLVGNHDQPGDASSEANALMAYEDMDYITIVDEPKMIEGILYLPYFHQSEDFVNACRRFPEVATVICHQEFNGARYDNGFYSKSGVLPDSIPQSVVLSGHIHGPQEFGKVRYLGSPRSLTVSDANSARFLTVVDHGSLGEILCIRTFPSPCRQIIRLRDTPEAPVDIVFDPRHRYHVDIVGPATWIEKRQPLFAGKSRVRTERTDKTIVKVKESEGLDKALRRYMAGFKPQLGTSTEILEGLANARIFSR